MTATIQEKFHALGTGMGTSLVERWEEIEIFKLALVSGHHAFLLGEPGIAKSMLFDVGIAGIDGLQPDDYFHTLFMKSSTPESVFGPLDILALKEGRYRFIPEGFLPLAKIAFVDEIWKANGAILNALLWAVNERLYRNDGKVETIPLHSMFCASNEMPESDELLAIYDRFTLRRVVKRISEPGNFVTMLKGVVGGRPAVEKSITWDEIMQAHVESKQVRVPADVLDALSDVKEKLRNENIFPSDRRFANCIPIVQAAAWLDGETEVDVNHLHTLRHVLWGDPNDIATVESIVLALSNPVDIKIGGIQEGLSSLSTEIDRVINDGGDEDQRERSAGEIFTKIDETKDELRSIRDQLSDSNKRSVRLEAATDQLVGLAARVLTKIFTLPPEKVEKGLKKFKAEITGEPEVPDAAQ